MIKEAIDKIVSLATPKVFSIYDDEYTNDPNMKRITPHIDRVDNIGFSSLDSVVQALTVEIQFKETKTEE